MKPATISNQYTESQKRHQLIVGIRYVCEK
ncbi:uncharacterized protein METZ01_LOCUS185218 [marine metagenome]|uniref:Uncharacterized protein n=1 Tax=marine metagenome TaxID=408172 RepID=A0A382D2T9_9ZZZZ